MLVSYYQYFQYLSLIAALVYFKSLKRFSLELMVPLLVVTCVVETLATNCYALGLTTNYQIYSGYVVLGTPLYLLLFRKIISWRKGFKSIYDIVSAGSIIFLLIDLFYLERGTFLTYTMILVLVLHVLLSCIILSNLAMDETREVRLVVEPYFWLSAGLLLFASGTVVLLGLRPFILENGLQLFGEPLYRSIIPMLNVILYSCYSYAFFLCNKHQHKFLPS